MHSPLVILSLVATVVRAKSCKFGLISSGGQSGHVGQLPDGQNRIGGDYPPATYEINDGGIVDSSGKGCILTPPIHQFQCDDGVDPTRGFSISASGDLSYKESRVFFACPASDTEWNIYTTPVPGQLECVQISLNADKCYSKSTPDYGYKPSYPSLSYVQAPSYSTPNYGCVPSTVTITKTVTKTVAPTKGYSGGYPPYGHAYKPHPSSGYGHHKGGYYGGPPKYKKPSYGHKYGHGYDKGYGRGYKPSYGNEYGHDYGKEYGHGYGNGYGNKNGYGYDHGPNYDHGYEAPSKDYQAYEHVNPDVATKTTPTNSITSSDNTISAKSRPDTSESKAFPEAGGQGNGENKLGIPFPSLAPFALPTIPTIPQVSIPSNPKNLEIKKFQTVSVPVSSITGGAN